jgi:V/A-type H+-transporting ATPase subunit A
MTLISSVSPPGADFSEPVTQAVLRPTRVFWGLDQKLAWRRHFPAINWLTSYSGYVNDLIPWFQKVSKEWQKLREKIISTLSEEAELERIVRVVGIGALPEKEKFILEVARIIKEDFLQQDSFNPKDMHTDIEKQISIMKSIVDLHERGIKGIGEGKKSEDILTEGMKEKFARLKYD